MTVVGPSLTQADAHATTAFAMGLAGPAWVAGREGYDVWAATADDRAVWSPGLDAVLVPCAGGGRSIVDTGTGGP